MPDKLTDGELIHRLRVLKEHGGNIASAGRSIDQKRAAMSASIQEAKQRGLTAEAKITSPLDQARIALAAATRELKSIRKDNLSVEEVRQQIYGLAATTPDPPKWIIEPSKVGATGVPMTIWSDWHWGETINATEVGGVNSYNRGIAKSRLKHLIGSTIDLAKHHMVRPDYPGIVVCLGGDMIGGSIHPELQDTNDGYVQQSLLEVQDQLAAALTTMADEFGKVFVPCVVGNHGRETMKPRMKGRVYTSYEWNLFCQLERHFAKDPRVQFLIPGETDAHFSVLGHRFLLTHGDALGVKGGDGIIGALGPIARGTFKVGRSESQIGRDFDTMLIGHYHTYIPRSEAVPVIVNGAMKGYDEYARVGLRVPYSRPSQALWFVNAKHGITAQWAIYLDTMPKKAGAKANAPWLTWQGE